MCDVCSDSVEDIIDVVFVVFGCEILLIILGCVLIEVDVCLLFDIEVMVVKVKYLIVLYEVCGVVCECVLIKIVLMWEGICVVD